MANRTYKRHLTAADRRAKVIIESCVESGAGVEFIEDAPNFRYTPLTPKEMGTTSFKGREKAKPSGRGSVACGRGNTLKLKTWSPAKIDASPMYKCPMKGDSEALRHARHTWAEHGDPTKLRAYLEAEACARAYEQQKAESATQLELMKEAA